MLKTKSLLFLLILTILSSHSFARNIADIDIAESVRIADTNLILNGSGIRTKLIFDIYIGSLYSKSKVSSLDALIKQQGPYRVSMHILYHKIIVEKLNKGWREGFENNLSMDELEELQPAMDAFYRLFKPVKRGDVIDIDMSNGVTTVFLNGVKLGEVVNQEFPYALLRIWLGEVPADADLKTGMLGD